MGITTIAIALGKRFWKEIAVVALVLGAIWAFSHWLEARDKAAYQEGYTARDAIVQADITKAAAARQKRIEDSFGKARKVDQTLLAKERSEAAAFRLLAGDLSLRLEAQERTPYVFNPEKPNEKPLLGQSVLDAGTVSLLNAARTAPVRLDANGNAAFDGDGKGTAAPYVGRTVTGRELADNDLEVVRRYRALALKHNALVEFVGEQCVAPAAPK